MKKHIYSSYSPNTRIVDLLLNIRLFTNPFAINKLDKKLETQINQMFTEAYPNSSVFLYNYARSALYELLGALNVGAGDSVISQAFTCIAAVNPVIWRGAEVRFIDISSDNLSIDPKRVEDAIDDSVKVLIAQYTMGLHPDMKAIRDICDQYNIFLVEDCTQVLPDDRSRYPIGMYGDAVLFSFGRDKVVSGVNGGVLLINDKALTKRISKRFDELPLPSYAWTFKELFYPIAWWKIKKTLHLFKLGNVLHILFTKLGLIPRSTSTEEKQGVISSEIPRRLPYSLGKIALRQLIDLNMLNQHRRDIAEVYDNGIVEAPAVHKFVRDTDIAMLRYPLRIESRYRNNFLKHMEALGIQLGDWYSTPIAPDTVDSTVVGYDSGDCPNAEKIGSEIVNLPTHVNVSLDDAKRIVTEINSFFRAR